MHYIERVICLKLEDFLKPSGFALNRNWGYFVRPQPYGHDSLVIYRKRAASPLAQHHEFGVHCAIRHECIETPWNAMGWLVGEYDQRQTNTLVLGDPRGSLAPQLVVNASSVNEGAQRVAAEALALFYCTALSFYRRFARLTAIEELVNHEPLSQLVPYSIGAPLSHRLARSLLLAKIANPARYPSVRAIAELDTATIRPDERASMLRYVDHCEVVAPPPPATPARAMPRRPALIEQVRLVTHWPWDSATNQDNIEHHAQVVGH